MTTNPVSKVIAHLRKVALAGESLSDGQLLDSFIARQDEAAFHILVKRHGPSGDGRVSARGR